MSQLKNGVNDMAKKVFIGVGHGGSDPGAVGNGLKEKDVNLETAKACYTYLKKHGVYAKMSRTADSEVWISERVKGANAYNADIAVDIHYNAGGGDGAEVYYTKNDGVGKTLAENILAEVKKIGQNSRGAKTKLGSNGKDYFAFIRETKMPSVLVECAFLDNKNDVKIVDTASERKAMGEAIAKGIMKTLGVADKTSEIVLKNDKSNKPAYAVKTKKTYSGAFPKLPTRGYFQKGDTGTQVKNLQKFLNWYGNYKLDVDGEIGSKTISAVKKFQTAEKITADGYFGKNSLAKAKAVKK